LQAGAYDSEWTGSHGDSLCLPDARQAKPRHVVRGFAGLTRRGAVLGGSIRLI
jgi:hypothetical protein